MMCLQSVSQQKEGRRIHIETNGIMNTALTLEKVRVIAIFPEYRFISCRF